MRLTVTIDREEGGRFIGEVRELPGCLVYGETRSEANALALACALHILADEVERGERSARSVASLDFATSTELPLVPNAETRAAMEELRAGGGRHFRNASELMADLHEGD